MRSFAFVLALALALTGCIQNMSDLKDRLGTNAEEPVQPAASVDQTPVATSPEVNTTKVTKAPVARISVFAGTGALLFKSTFQADDPAEIVVVAQDDAINAIASDSEALEPGATIASYAWTLDGKPVAQTRQAALTMDAGGLHQLTLTVTDSHGKADTQSLKIGVQAPLVVLESEYTSDPLAGADGLGISAEATISTRVEYEGAFSLRLLRVVALPSEDCDVELSVLDEEGNNVAESDINGIDKPVVGPAGIGFNQTEVVEIENPSLESYGVKLAPFACVAPDGIQVRVQIVLSPTIPGLEAPHNH